MSEFYTGFVSEAILLAIGRAILRKQTRDNITISDYEAKGHAMVIQGRYNYVPPEEAEIFCGKVLAAFKFAQQSSPKSLRKMAHLEFQKDETLGNSILDEELISDLNSALKS